jgi:CheY-like chemotaxis protein
MAKLLIADDDTFNILLTKTMIKNIMPEIEIFEANNGKIASELAMDIQFDLIFMDVQMPEMNGIEATEAIRQSEKSMNQNTIIVGLTASSSDDDKIKCISSGMNVFLTKPIDKSKLSETIITYLSN